MLSVTESGYAQIICGRCQEPADKEICVAIKHSDLNSIQFVCIDCAEILKEKFPRLSLCLATDYFEALLAKGRPVRVFPAGS